MKRLTFVLFVIGLLALAGPASAGVVLYDNTTSLDNYNVDAWNISTGSGFSVADNFTLSSGANVTSVNFWEWVAPNDPLTSVDWAILDNSVPTDPIGSGSVLFSGTASGGGLTDTFVEDNSFSYQIDEISFSTGSLSLGAGTYWLLLQNAVNTNGVFWDQSDGPSVAYQNTLGALAQGVGNCGGISGAGGPSCSESFQIVGDNTATPEPGSLMLFGSGILAVVGVLRRRLNR